MAGQRSIVRSQIIDVDDMFFRNDQHMHRGLWCDIAEGKHLRVFVHDVGFDLAVGHFAEQAIHRDSDVDARLGMLGRPSISHFVRNAHAGTDGFATFHDIRDVVGARVRGGLAETMLKISPDLQSLPASLSAAWVSDALLTVQREYGMAPAVLLAEAGVAADALERPDALLPLIDVFRIFVHVLVRSNDHALGLVLGAGVQPRSYPVLGYVILGSATLGEAIDRLLRFERIVGELGRTTLNDEGDGHLSLRWECPVPMPAARYLQDAAIAGWVALGRAIQDAQYAPLRACFAFPEPSSDERRRYESFFGCTVAFNAPWSGVVLQRDWLALPLRSADPLLGDMMEQRARALLADFSAGQNLGNEVRSAIYRRLTSGEPSIDVVAADLGLTTRSLQIRLRKSSINFTELVDDLRRSLAALWAADARLTLMDVALLLGFAEQSSFIRAFKRWYGMTPGEYRKEKLVP